MARIKANIELRIQLEKGTTIHTTGVKKIKYIVCGVCCKTFRIPVVGNPDIPHKMKKKNVGNVSGIRYTHHSNGQARPTYLVDSHNIQ